MTSTMSRRAALGASLLAVALVASACVSGPLPIIPNATLEARGYQEREFFVDGKATAYGMVGTWGTSGHWAAEPTTTANYRTRLLVRRPIDPADFNGSVLVEWLNVSSGFDVDVTYGAAIDELLREGYAYVGVSAQKVGVDSLKTDASRYGSLNHPGDAYSYDIFTQAGLAVRGTLGADPLGGLEPQRLIAAGESQSAGRLVTYVNAVHPLVQAFDAFLVYSRGASAASLFPGATMPQTPWFRTDLAEPLIDVQAEGDVVVLRSHLARQPDTANVRLWEVAGGAHADEHTLSRQNPPNPTAPGSPCQFRSNSASTFGVVSAAVDALDTWLRVGVAPKPAPRLALGDDLASDDPVLRDEHGNAIGGIRLPEIVAPIATITGLPNPAPPGAPPLFQAFCRLFGQTHPFSAEELAALYPTHDDYVEQFVRAANRAVRDGFLLPEDADVFKQTAAAADVPPASP